MTKDNIEGMPKDINTGIAWVLGIATIALTLVVLLIMFGNLSGSLGFERDSTTLTNESGYAINDTSFTLTNGASARGFVSLTVSAVYNATNDGSGGQLLLATGNYTVSGTAGTIVGAAGRSFNYTDVNITYVVSSRATSEIDTNSVIGNYSTSAVNVSNQFPVIGTIIGILLLLTILIGILIFMVKKLGGITVGSKSRNFG